MARCICGGSLEMWWLIGYVVAHLEMWWLIRPGFESGISHNDPGALKDHCVIL